MYLDNMKIVDCSTCGAKVGEPCKNTKTGLSMFVMIHRDREINAINANWWLANEYESK